LCKLLNEKHVIFNVLDLIGYWEKKGILKGHLEFIEHSEMIKTKHWNTHNNNRYITQMYLNG